MNEQGQAFLDGLEQGFSSTSNMTCNSTIEAKGNGIVVKMLINELENVSQSDKAAMQDTMPSMASDLKPALDTLKTIVPELQFMELHICEKDGDILASITVQAN